MAIPTRPRRAGKSHVGVMWRRGFGSDLSGAGHVRAAGEIFGVYGQARTEGNPTKMTLFQAAISELLEASRTGGGVDLIRVSRLGWSRRLSLKRKPRVTAFVVTLASSSVVLRNLRALVAGANAGSVDAAEYWDRRLDRCTDPACRGCTPRRVEATGLFEPPRGARC